MNRSDSVAPIIDLAAIARELGEDLNASLEQLRQIYADVDARNAANTANLDLPCHRGCDACCHESVFLTPLEFLGVWDWVQVNLSTDNREKIVAEALRLYRENQTLIEALDGPPPPGQKDHFELASQLRFRCPLLGADGACSVYPMRELLARSFGCSFDAAGGIYGCSLVGDHLAGKTVTLLSAPRTAKRLQALPLTSRRQVYPYFIYRLYGDSEGVRPRLFALGSASAD